MSYNIGWLDPEHRLVREHGLQFHPVEACMTKEFVELISRAEQDEENAASSGILMNTSRAIEAEFIDEIAAHPMFKELKLFAAGPLNPLLDATARTPGQTRHECMDWLDKQPLASVLYVSFGTTSSLRGDQVAELAAALKGSKQRFIWVLRDADRANIFADSGESRHAELLSRFTAETEGVGLVITGWAPQLEILAHGATAAFMSHCGWNSTMESLSYGKPILAWPMHSDQPWDAELVCKYLKAGLLVRPWEKHSEVVPAEAIQEVIEEAMLSEKGMTIRRRAKELGEAVRASVADGGSSRKGLDDFAARLPNGEAFGLQCVAMSYNIGWLDPENRLVREHGLKFHPVEACMPKEFVEFISREEQDEENATSSGMLMNTSRAIEAEFIDEIAAHPMFKEMKLFAVGPLNPLLDATARTPGQTRHECMDWLDKQPAASVLYVSFGTTSSLRGDQVAELAAALKGSKQRFIWVLRDADRADIFADSGESRHAELLSRFTAETEGVGLVITGWAPQLEILAHGATAAFMSHCGWNSTMESLSHGKPILAWPMHSDQPWDAELVCKYLKAGLLVRPLEKHSEVVPAEAIQEVIEEAMLPEKGMAIRLRAMELGEVVRASVADGGSSRKDLDDFGHLNQLMHLSLLLASRGLDTRHECMDWLDKQPLASVLYVSFGTTSSLRGDQVAELAAALKGSKQRFIWVLRDADRANIFADSGESRHAELLSRFTAETEGVGLVITGWAPQLEILAHGATAAFMSHCGWNSTMESLSYGKPILAWPMHSDQPWDAELVCKYLKAGLLVRPWEKHSEVVPAEAIQEVIEEAMLSEKGMTIRRRAKELGEAVRASVADGGSSRKGLDDFVGYITR
uniref:Glycosyltransferase N-terminal domain-containing protein n=1 Tax=Oryza barthii TaxID=65489 RepID=A0A0D3FYS8_9ORYZ